MQINITARTEVVGGDLFFSGSFFLRSIVYINICRISFFYNIYFGFGYNKMSHAAAAFILQKSNEVLSMIKAFKRKTNGNANGATTTQNDASNSTVSQSKRTSSVNCMNLSLNDEHLLFSDNIDASSNIYTEIDLSDNLPTKNLVTESNSTSSTESISCDILRFLFNDSLNSSDLQYTDDHNQSETNKINSYVNESVTAQAIAQMEMCVINGNVVTEQNLYEINSDATNVANAIISNKQHQQQQQKQRHKQQTEHEDEFAGNATVTDDSSLKSNKFFSNISKSLKHKLKHMMSEENVLNESLSDVVMADTAGFSGNHLAKDDIEKASLKKRIKFKLKTGLHFFKDAKVCCHILYTHR